MTICVYDSGIGGRAVYRLLEKYIQDANLSQQFSLYYFGDEANFPYGTKSESELQSIIVSNIRRFSLEGIDLVAVACNTASAVVERHWQELGGLESIRTIVRPTVDVVNRNPEQYPQIVVIASQFTAEQHVYQKAINRVQPQIKVIEHAQQLLIYHIEMGLEDQYRKEVARIVASVPQETSLLLGCTHFSYIDGVFYEEIKRQNKQFRIIDPARELAKAVVKWIIGNRQ